MIQDFQAWIHQPFHILYSVTAAEFLLVTLLLARIKNHAVCNICTSLDIHFHKKNMLIIAHLKHAKCLLLRCLKNQKAF